MYTLMMALSFVTFANAQFTKLWAKFANGTDFSWFTSASNNVTGIAFNPVTNKVLVGDRNNNIYILNSATGAQEGTVALGGDIGTEIFKFNKIRVTSDGVIYGISLTNSTNSGAGPFLCRVYRWENQTTAPTLCASFTVTERVGDSFGLSGTGNNTILYASGAGLVNNNVGPNMKIYVLTTTNGISFLNTSTIDVPSGTSQWVNRSVDPIGATPSAGLWVDMSGGPARRLAVTGTTCTAAFNTTTGFNSGQVSDAYCGMRYLAPDAGGKKYLAFAGANNAGDGITMKLLDVTNEATVTTVGTDTLQTSPGVAMTWNTNNNGTGDVAFKKNGDGSYNIYYVATNNGIAGIRTAQTLPVSYNNFSASLQNKSVLLNFSTSTESNNNGFEIEKSINGKDFSTIGFVASKAVNGNSNSPINYQFEDAKLLSGKSFYRLKQVDKDGKNAVSKIESINYNTNINFSVKVLSNPVSDNLVLNVKSNVNRTIQINITNSAGATLLARQQTIVNGENNFSLAANQLPKGILFVTIKDKNNNTQEATIQIIKD